MNEAHPCNQSYNVCTFVPTCGVYLVEGIPQGPMQPLPAGTYRSRLTGLICTYLEITSAGSLWLAKAKRQPGLRLGAAKEGLGLPRLSGLSGR